MPDRASREQVGISIQNGDFSWATEQDSSSPFLLSNINVSFDAGQLTAVVGHVGCGRNRAVF